MKKVIFYIILMMVIPLIMCVGFHLIYKDVPIGRGEGLKSRYMNRDILLEIHGLYKSIDIEEYVAGILPTVISPDYEMEALKTQAVLIRTNVLKEMEEKNTKNAEDISYDYLSKEDREELWGKRHYDKWEAKTERAVSDTSGIVLKKEGNLIMAVYHEVSIGKTASAKEILDEDIAYLQSVDSSYDVEARNYMNLITYSYQEINERIIENNKDNISGEDNEANDGKNNEENNDEKIEIKIEDSTENGFVRSVSIGGKIYTCDEVMQMFELPSNNYYVEENDSDIRFVCLGKGNCLGLSQYGANVLANQGMKMEDIIRHYYKDVSIEHISGN